MNAHTEEHLDLCAGHVLGNLYEGESKKWVEHVTIGCAQCESALERFSEAALLVAHAAPLSPPPAALRAKVLSDALLASATQSAGERIHEPPRPLILRTGIGITGWICVYLIATIAGLVIYYNMQLGKMKDDQLALQQQLTRVSAQMVEAARWEPAIAGSSSRMLTLRPVRPGESGRATVFLDPASRRSVVTTAELPQAGGQLVAWAIGDAGPVPLGFLTPDRAGNALLRAEPPAGGTAIRGFMISRERSGVLPLAPGEVVLQGRVE